MGKKRKQSVFAIVLILWSSFFSTVEYAGAETQKENNSIDINYEDSSDTVFAASGGSVSGGAVSSGGALTTGSSIQSTLEPKKDENIFIPEEKNDATECPTMAPDKAPTASFAPATKKPISATTKEPEQVATTPPIIIIKPDITTVPEITKIPEITKTPIVTKTPVPTITPELPVDATPIPTTVPTPKVTVEPTADVGAQRPSKATSVPNTSVTQPPLDESTTPSICTVCYVLNGGKNHTKNPKKIVNMNIPINLYNAKRRGYLFVGWYTENTYKHKITQIANTQKSNIILYAKWRKVSVEKAGISSVKSLKGGKIQVKIKRKESVKGYEYMYSTSRKFLKKYRVRTTKNPKILSRLKKGINYYIKVRSYKMDSYGKKVYGKYSKVVKCKMKKK